MAGIIARSGPLCLADPDPHPVDGIPDLLGRETFACELLLLTYAAVLVFGLPAHLLLRRLGRTDFPSYLVAGLGAAYLFGLAMIPTNDLLFPIDPGNPFALRFSSDMARLIAFFAMLPAAIFWFAAVKRDRRDGDLSRVSR